MSAVAHIDEYKTGRFYRDDFRGELSWNGYERNVLLRNVGSRSGGELRFVDVAPATGADDVRDSRGVAVADYDNDGDLDIAVNHNPGDTGRQDSVAAALYRNDVGNRRHWLAVELVGTESNRDGVGATVSVEAGGGRQQRLRSAGSGYASQHSSRLYFGLGEHEVVPEMVVRWPSGRVDRFSELAADRLLRVTEAGGIEVAALPSVGAGRERVPRRPGEAEEEGR